MNEVAKPLFILFEKTWKSSEAHTDWTRVNTIPIFKKRKENCRPVSHTSASSMVRDWVLLETMPRHKENKVIDDSQHGSTKGKLCLTNVVVFCEEVHGWWVREEGLMSAMWTCAEHLMLTIIPLSLN